MNLLKEEDTSKEKLVAKNINEQTSNSESEERHDNNREILRMDPCLDKHCGAGRVCQVKIFSIKYF